MTARQPGLVDNRLRVLSLFSGIGGIDLGLERAGMQIVGHCEIDPYACRVLTKRWPDVPNLGDVTQIDWSGCPEVDVIAGGFPCQPVSLAGNRKGNTDDRWLWPEFLRAIRAIRPRYVIVENVPGLATLGGLGVVADLAGAGYVGRAVPVSAAEVGAPHLRKRIFLVAHANCERGNRGTGQHRSTGGGRFANASSDRDRDREQAKRRGRPLGSLLPTPTRQDAHNNGGGAQFKRNSLPLNAWAASNADSGRQSSESQHDSESPAWVEGSQWNDVDRRDSAAWDAARSPLCGVDDGLSHRVDRLRCLGNAVVPQVAEFIGRIVVAHAASDERIVA